MKFNQHMIMLFVYFTQQGIWDQIPYGIFHCLLVGFEFLDYWQDLTVSIEDRYHLFLSVFHIYVKEVDSLNRSIVSHSCRKYKQENCVFMATFYLSTLRFSNVLIYFLLLHYRFSLSFSCPLSVVEGATSTSCNESSLERILNLFIIVKFVLLIGLNQTYFSLFQSSDHRILIYISISYQQNNTK